MSQSSSKATASSLEKSKDNKLLKFTPKELKLYEFLRTLDGSGKLARMLEGVVIVLLDKNNPVRFAQAANTIRCLTDSILDLKGQTKRPHKLLDTKTISVLEKQFSKILSIALGNISDPKERKETEESVVAKFRQLKNLLSYGTKTKKDQLLGLLYHKDGLRIIPKNLQDSAEKLAKIYHYFAEVLHEHREDEPDFINKWVYFQDFLIIVASGFFDIAKEIDQFLEDRTINNEKSK